MIEVPADNEALVASVLPLFEVFELGVWERLLEKPHTPSSSVRLVPKTQTCA